jgi:hypothetical protein
VSLLGLLPGLLDWLPHLIGGGGIVSGLAALLPSARKYAMIALAVLLGLSVIGLLWYRDEYKDEVADRLADKAAAQAAVLEQQRKAAALSDELVIQQAIAFGNTGKKAGSYVEQIRKSSDADRMRVGSRGVRDLIAGGGGGPPAGGGAPAAVPGPGAGGASPETATDDRVEVERVNGLAPMSTAASATPRR